MAAPAPLEVLTLREVADLLRVSESTVRRLVREKRLTSIQIRGTRRVTSQAVARYLTNLDRLARQQ